MTEQELVSAVDVLGQYPARWEARQALGQVVERLRSLGYEVDGLEATEDDPYDDAQDPDGWPGNGDAYSPVPGIAASPSFAAPFPPAVPPRQAPSLGVVRVVGAGVLAATAIALWFGMAPDEVPSQAAGIAAALSDYGRNNAATDGAPQQAVVNGWIARDLLTIQTKQGDDAARAEQQAADRLAAEAALIVVAIGFGIATRGAERP